LPGRFQTEVEHLKLVINQATATAPQLAVAAYVENGGLDRHLRRIRVAYRTQMSQMIDAIERHLPDTTRHTTPAGGHVLWVQVPGLDAMALHDAALAEGIHIAPGPMFSASGGYRDHVRLNTGFPWTPETDRQVVTLGRLIERQLG
jgi:DNA-binding transcriptional MocR family regulator